MTVQNAHIQIVDSGDIPDYPISSEERLDSHYFLQFNVARYSRSDFRRLAYRHPEVGFFGLELFFKSHGEVPLGTLPSDDEELAFLLGLPLERWQAMRERSFSPLYNWHPVRCDNGAIRLAHPVVQSVMVAALQGHLEHKASNEEKAVYQRRQRLIKVMRDCKCSEASCADDVLVSWLDEWLLEHHKGQRRMPQIQHSIQRGLRAAAAAGVLKVGGNVR